MHEVRANTLVAAAGGFEANIPWLKQYWGDVADNFIVRGTPYNQGRVLRALLDRGARQVGDPTQCHAVAVDGRAPKFDGGIVTRVDCVPLGIVVNQEGRRFYDEGEDFWPKRYADLGPARGAAAGPDRACDHRSEGGRQVHAAGLSAGAGGHDPRARRQARARSGRAGGHRREVQCRSPARDVRLDGARRLSHRRSRAAEVPLGAAARRAALLQLLAPARDHLHLSRGRGGRTARG